MKRFWLIICLTALIICAAGIGIYREATHKLTHILTRLEENLPADHHFTYKTASPALFIGGATLRDVSFQTPSMTFHAAKIRLGHPHFSHDGSVSLSSLKMNQPDYQGPTFNLHSSKAIFRHLLIPSTEPPPSRTDLTTIGMHSLATIMSFKPQDLSTLRFGRAHVEGLDFAFPSHRIFLHSALNISHIHIGTFTLEGYGIGLHAFTELQHVALTLSLSKKSTDYWPTPLANFLLPETTHSSFPITLTFNNLSARRGHIRWLQHPFHGNFALSKQFQKSPFQSFWESPGSLRLHGLSLAIGTDTTQSQIRLNHLIATRRDEASTLRTEAELRGFHVQPSQNRRFSMPVSGNKSVLYINETSHKNNELWENNADYHLTLSDIGTLFFNTHTYTPTENPFQKSSFSEQAIIDKAHLSLKGEHFIDLWFHFLNPTMSAKEWEKQHNDLLSHFGTLLATHPLLTPMMDYILLPKDRTLNIAFDSLSLRDINNLPFTDSINTLLDAAHITSVTTN